MPAPWKGCLFWHAGLTHYFAKNQLLTVSKRTLSDDSLSSTKKPALHEAEQNCWWHRFFNWIVTACAGGRVAKTNVFRSNCFFNSRSAADAQRIPVYRLATVINRCGRGSWPWQGTFFHNESVEYLGSIVLFRAAPTQRVCVMSMRHWREVLKWMFFHAAWLLFSHYFISFHLEKYVQLRKLVCCIGTMSSPLFICNHTPEATQQMAFQRLRRHFHVPEVERRNHAMQLMTFRGRQKWSQSGHTPRRAFSGRRR